MTREQLIINIDFIDKKKLELSNRGEEFWAYVKIGDSLEELLTTKYGVDSNCIDISQQYFDKFERFKKSLGMVGSQKEIVDNIRMVSFIKNQRKDKSIYYSCDVSIQGFHLVSEIIENHKIGNVEETMLQITRNICSYLDIQSMCIKDVDKAWRNKHNDNVNIFKKS